MPETELNNTIVLDGKVYAIREGVRAQAASEFQAGLRTGSPQYDTREGAFTLTLEDWSGGLGILDADERKNEHMRVRYSNGADTRFPKGLTLGPKVNSVTLTGVTFPSGIPQATIRQWKDQLIIGAGRKIFKVKSDLSVTDITPTTLDTDCGTTAEHADLLVHDFNDGFFANNPAILWGLKNTGTGGTLRQYYVAAATDILAASWSPQGDLSNVEELNSMVSYDQKVLKIQGAFMKESNEGTTDTWGDLAVTMVTTGNPAFMTVPKFSYFIGTHRVPFGPDFMPWLILAGDGGYQGKVAMLDYWARQLKPLELNIGRVSDGYMLDEGVVVSTGYDLWKIVPSDPPSLLPLHVRTGAAGQGLPPEYDLTVISGIGSVNGDLVCGLTNLKTGNAGRIWILRHNGAGWHVVTEQNIATGIVLDIGTYEKPASYYGFRSAPYLYWVTWDGTTCKLHYTKEVPGGGSPEQDPSYEYASSGSYETPWMYGGFEDIDGALLRLKIRAKNLTAQETVTVHYRTDDDDSAAWTTLGVFDNDTTELVWGTNGEGGCFRSVRFRFDLARTTVTRSPAVRAVILLYDKKPLTRMMYNFVVDVSRMIRETTDGDSDPFTGFTGATLTYRQVYDVIRAAKDSCLMIPFQYDDEPTRYVKIQAIPSTEEEIHDSMRRGAITVQVVEVVVPTAVSTAPAEEPPPSGGDTGQSIISQNGLMVDLSGDADRKTAQTGVLVDLSGDSNRDTAGVGVKVDVSGDSNRSTAAVLVKADVSGDTNRDVAFVGVMVDFQYT